MNKSTGNQGPLYVLEWVCSLAHRICSTLLLLLEVEMTVAGAQLFKKKNEFMKEIRYLNPKLYEIGSLSFKLF